jgi:hypothetical protein
VPLANLRMNPSLKAVVAATSSYRSAFKNHFFLRSSTREALEMVSMQRRRFSARRPRQNRCLPRDG